MTAEKVARKLLMNPADLRAWQAHMGYTYTTAADALGVNRSTYANWLQDTNRASGQPTVIDKRTALACAALAAGLDAWGMQGSNTAQAEK